MRSVLALPVLWLPVLWNSRQSRAQLGPDPIESFVSLVGGRK
jgi:hypothetical protein